MSSVPEDEKEQPGQIDSSGDLDLQGTKFGKIRSLQQSFNSSVEPLCGRRPLR